MISLFRLKNGADTNKRKIVTEPFLKLIIFAARIKVNLV